VARFPGDADSYVKLDGDLGGANLTEVCDPVRVVHVQNARCQFTLCFWMTSVDRASYGTVFSYAVDGQDNEVVLTDYGGFVLAVKGQSVHEAFSVSDLPSNFSAGEVKNFLFPAPLFLTSFSSSPSLAGQKVVTDSTSRSGQWDFICADWASRAGLWHVRKNGKVEAQGRNLAAGAVVLAGGSVVLGQEQDAVSETNYQPES